MDNGEYLKKMGKRIRTVRGLRGLSIDKLEAITKIHCSTISEIENGKRDCHILILKKIADTLQVDVKDFL